ncbi:MAG: O-antigen ligase family protein [Proteobacteria bacterium]|nr:O-antigen ligase family protein [Pseudomonadota bacterium]
MPISPAVPPEAHAAGGQSVRVRWAPWWLLASVLLWPWPAPANVAVAAGAIAVTSWLGLRRFRGGDALLSREAWALSSALFFSYWLPQLFSCIGAVDGRRALYEVLADLRFLPLVWLAAIAVHRGRDRRIVYAGIALIAALWALDGLVQALSGHSLGGAANVEPGSGVIRISGIFGAHHPHLGQALASLAAFPLGWAGRRLGSAGWLAAAALIGAVVVLSGSRAAWLTFVLVLLLGGWRLLGWKRLLAACAVGALGIAALAAVFPNELHERIARSEALFAGGRDNLDVASNGRVRIWAAALCMAREHPLTGVGVRGYRDAYAQCAPVMATPPPWGEGGALHAHQIVLEVLSETGLIGLSLWLIGAALAIRAWRCADAPARARAAMPALALAVTVFPLNTHLAFYSSFWGGALLVLAGLYVGALFGEEPPPAATAA